MALATSMYAIPTWTRTVALVREPSALRTAIAPDPDCDVPSVYACYRFAARLRLYGDMLMSCIDRVTAGLAAQLPEYGRNIACTADVLPSSAGSDGSSTIAHSLRSGSVDSTGFGYTPI